MKVNKIIKDTGFSNHVGDYKQIITEIGFQQVLYETFRSSTNHSNESFEIWFNCKDGTLLRFDTYFAEDINSAHLYLNWKPKDRLRIPTILSGHSTNGIWSGDFDAREKLVSKIQSLKEYGKFVTPWVELPYLWLLHYEDTRNGFGSYDPDAITNKRLDLLPLNVKVAIGLKDEG